MPNYPLAFSVENSKKVAEAIAKNGGVATFSQIQATSDVKGSVLNHHLNRLQRLKIVEKEVKGTYRLTYKTPLCFIFPTKTRIPIAYFGLLGKREARKEPEPEIAIELLKKEKLKPDLIYVTTSPEALNEWKDLKLPYQWILCYEEEIIDIESVKQKNKATTHQPPKRIHSNNGLHISNKTSNNSILRTRPNILRPTHLYIL